MRLLYSLTIILYTIAIQIASLFHSKAALWYQGRVGWRKNLTFWRRQYPGRLIWIHCASLGEFEQGRPLIEALRRREPKTLIFLTFFSPSGFEIRKHYGQVDLVTYLPSDTPLNASRFLEILKPDLVIFVKYEYWANYFFEIHKRNIKLYTVSAILRPDQRFFGSLSFFWKKILSCVSWFFLQNEESQSLLRSIGFDNTSIAGDTRFDRVVENASKAGLNEEVKRFVGTSKCLVVGSSWPADEEMVKTWFDAKKDRSAQWKLILVPHEIGVSHITRIQTLFPEAALWTRRNGYNLETARVLILDTIGQLSAVYRYADIAMIGGGFGKGIHNTLEAAVWRIPVVFGPEYSKFLEAKELIAVGGGFTVKNQLELSSVLTELAESEEKRRASGLLAGKYVEEKSGATGMIMRQLEEWKVLI